MEVLGAYFARPLLADVYAAPKRCPLGARIRRLAGVIGVGSCRVHLDDELWRHLGHHLAEYALCRGRSADVAHADEQHVEMGLS